LAADPDRLKIIGDLEQAIAEKIRRFLSPHKTVVTLLEIRQVLTEMGPVNGAAQGEEGEEGAGGAGGAAGKPGDTKDAPKRLYRMRESGMIAGICAGIGAYAGIDATIVRIVFALVAIATHGAWVLV